MDRTAGREDHGNANGPTRHDVPHGVDDLVRLLARIAAERDFREALEASRSSGASRPQKGET